MAFMSMMIVFVLGIIAIVGVFTMAGAILLVISAFRHSDYKKKTAQNIAAKRTYIVFRIIGIICLLPAVAVVLIVLYGIISAQI